MVTAEQVGLCSQRLKKLDGLIHRYIDSGKLPGAITMITRSDQPVIFNIYGKMDLEANKPMAKDTLFRIYSMTKPIVSVAILMLYEDGHFLLDDPVSRFIPAFKHLEVYVSGNAGQYRTKPADREMTIRDLLTHRAGLTYAFFHSSPVDEIYRAEKVDRCRDLKEFIEKLSQLPLLYSPGTSWNYSVAHDVLGYLVELISEKNLEQFLIERLFLPLNMVDTSFSVPTDKLHRLSACYTRGDNDSLKLVDSSANSKFSASVSFLSGGGGLVSSADDYLRFCRMLYRQGELDGIRILSRKSIELMTTNHLGNNRDLDSFGEQSFAESSYAGFGYGLGVSVMLDPSIAQIIGTPGEFSWGGLASTYFWVDPKEELIVIFLTQLMPSSSYPIRREMRVLTYQAIIN